MGGEPDETDLNGMAAGKSVKFEGLNEGLRDELVPDVVLRTERIRSQVLHEAREALKIYI